jgi:DNA-binding Lrp family transcriptional regulator
VTGEADALVHVRATDIADLEAAVERLRSSPGIARTKTIIVLSRLIVRGDRG